MFNMSEHTHKQCERLTSQRHLTHEDNLNQDYDFKAQNPASRVENIHVPVMQALRLQFQTTWSASNTTKQGKTTTFVSTSKDREPPGTKAQLSTPDPFVH